MLKSFCIFSGFIDHEPLARDVGPEAPVTIGLEVKQVQSCVRDQQILRRDLRIQQSVDSSQLVSEPF